MGIINLPGIKLPARKMPSPFFRLNIRFPWGRRLEDAAIYVDHYARCYSRSYAFAAQPLATLPH